MRNNSSSLGLETSQLGRKKPFLPKLLAGKPRLGTPGACGGVQGKRLRWECLRDPPPSRCSLRGVQLQGDTPGLSPSGTRGRFSLPNSSQRSELKLRESLAAGGGVVQDAPARSQPLPNIPGTGMRIPKCRTCLTALRDGRCHIDVPDTALTSSTAGNVGIAAADPRRIRVPNPCSRFATSFCILLLIFALFTPFRT